MLISSQALYAALNTFKQHHFYQLPDLELRPAAVLIGFYQRGANTHILLTERSHNLPDHKGQIAFPGGKFDRLHDETLRDTVLRETQEEVGLDASAITLLGKLPLMPTHTGYLIQPFLAELKAPPTFDFNPGEIQSILEPPVHSFFRPEALKITYRAYKGQEYKIYNYPWREHNIWGITGYLLYHTLQALNTVLEGAREGGI